MKLNLKGVNWKKFFFNHCEKMVAGCIVLFSLGAMATTDWSRYTKSPDALKDKADTVKASFEKTPWPAAKQADFKVVDFVANAKSSFQRIPIAKYDFPVPNYWPVYRKQELAKEPEMLAVYDLIADYGDAVFALEPEIDESSTTLADAQIGAMAEEDENEFAPATAAANRPGQFGATSPLGFPEFGGSSAFPGSPAGHAGVGGPPSGMVSPAMGGGHAPSGGRPPFGSPSMSMPGGSHAGSDMMTSPNMSSDPSMMMAGAMPVGLAGAGYKPLGAKFIAVRGVFPLREQLIKFSKALNLSSESLAYPFFEIMDFTLERQTAVNGPDPWAGEWQKVNVDLAKERLLELVFAQELLDPQTIDAAITMPLPERMTGRWKTSLASHPKVDRYELAPEEQAKIQEIERRLIEQFDKMKEKAKPKDTKGGFTTISRDMRRTAGAVLRGADSEQFLQGIQASPMFAQGGQRPDLSKLKERITAAGRLLLFRYFDFDIEPGRAYRYRVKLQMRNPNFERPVEEVADPVIAQGPRRDSPLSDASNPVVVPQDVSYFLKDISGDPLKDPARRRQRTIAEVTIYQRDKDLGTMLKDTLKLTSFGQFIREEKEVEALNVGVPELKKEKKELATNDMLIDIAGRFEFSADVLADLSIPVDKKAKLPAYDQLVVVDEVGKLRHHASGLRADEEKRWEKRVKDERAAFASLTAPRPAVAPGSGLDELMMSGNSMTPEMMMMMGSGGPQRRPPANTKKVRGSGSGSVSPP